MGTKVKLKPHRQGDLDGLCGLYSIVNAINQLFDLPDVPKLSDDVFRSAALTLPKGNWPRLLWDGMDFDTLEAAARKACAKITRNTPITVKVERPFEAEDFANVAEFAEHLHGVARPGAYAAAIIRLDYAQARGGGAHWTVFGGRRKDQIRIFDGGTERGLPIRSWRLRGSRGDRFTPKETLLLRIVRIGDEQVP